MAFFEPSSSSSSSSSFRDAVVGSRAVFAGDVFGRGEAGYDAAVAALKASNGCAAGLPAAVLLPTSTADVARGVLAAAEARRQGLVGPTPLCLRGGGHSELHCVEGALALDFRRMSGVEVSACGSTVAFGPGATLGAVLAACGAVGRAVPVGIWPSVGVGSILQGGVGRLARRDGLSVDHIEAIEVVTANGSVRTVRAGADEGADLWWALRGAAPNFGAVTRLELRTVETPADVRFGTRVRFVADLSVEDDHDDDDDDHHHHHHHHRHQHGTTTAALEAVEAAARSLPRTQQCDVFLGWREGRPCVATSPTLLDGSEPLSPGAEAAFGVRTGDLRRGPLTALPVHRLADDLVRDVRLAHHKTDHQGADGLESYVRQCFVDELGPIGWAAILAALDAMPSPLSLITLQHGGGACRDATTTEAASCAHPPWEFSVVICALWTGGHADRPANERWADEAYAALEPMATSIYAVDVNPKRRPDCLQRETPLAFPAEGALDRLGDLKRRIDPTNLFRATVPLVQDGGCNYNNKP